MLASTDFAGIGTTLVGLAAVITAISQLSLRRKVNDTAKATEQIHEQVKPVNGTETTLAQKLEDTALTTVAIQEEVQTTNGIKLGELGERAEGRRVDEIPLADRTASEQQYSNALAEGGRDRGHEQQPTGQPSVRDT
jgi:hypothetical protein